MSKVFTALGMMSGTSMDGIDAAIIRTDGEKIHMLGPSFSTPYIPEMRALLKEAVEHKTHIETVEEALTLAHAEVVKLFLDQIAMPASEIDVIGFHGHTIDHRPKDGVTWQIGDGALLAQRTGIDVVNDFRSADVKAGGQGAPLVPCFHQALFADSNVPLILLNLGGVGNITYIYGQQPLMAFDTGPGNALLDQWMELRTGNPFDAGGKVAAMGAVDYEIVERYLAKPYYQQVPPKSLDRLDFSLDLVERCSLADGAATLAAITASCVLDGLKFLPHTPEKCYVAGGGRKNQAIMRQLSTLLPCEVQDVDIIGFDGDMLEAQAFAYLAVRSLNNMPYSFPETTGVNSASEVGGVFCPA